MADLDWKTPGPDFEFEVGMVVELKDGSTALVGDWLCGSSGKEIRDGGCGCCESIRLPEHVVRYAVVYDG